MAAQQPAAERSRVCCDECRPAAATVPFQLMALLRCPALPCAVLCCHTHHCRVRAPAGRDAGRAGRGRGLDAQPAARDAEKGARQATHTTPRAACSASLAVQPGPPPLCPRRPATPLPPGNRPRVSLSRPPATPLSQLSVRSACSPLPARLCLGCRLPPPDCRRDKEERHDDAAGPDCVPHGRAGRARRRRVPLTQCSEPRQLRACMRARAWCCVVSVVQQRASPRRCSSSSARGPGWCARAQDRVQRTR